MKKGFTLIEMLVVIVIISLLSTIVFPIITNQLADKKEEISNTTRQLIIDAAELYVREKNINYGSILLKDLIDDDKLENPIKDYKTGNSIPLSLKIYIDYNMNACLEGEEGCTYYEKKDDTAPTTDKPSATSTTNSITVIMNQNDPESTIKTKKYAIKKQSDTAWGEWQDSNEFKGLTKNTTYYVKTKAINEFNLSSESKILTISTKSITAPSIVLSDSTGAITGMEWRTSKSYRVIYNSTDVTSPYYFVKPIGISATINVKAYACGTSSQPSNCSTTSSTGLVAGTWYKVDYKDSTMTILQFKGEGSFVAMTTDGLTNYNSSAQTTRKIDYVTGIGIGDYATNSPKYKFDTYYNNGTGYSSSYKYWKNLVDNQTYSITTSSGWKYTDCNSSASNDVYGNCIKNISPALYFDGTDDFVALDVYNPSTMTIEIVDKRLVHGNPVISSENGGGIGVYGGRAQGYYTNEYNGTNNVDPLPALDTIHYSAVVYKTNSIYYQNDSLSSTISTTGIAGITYPLATSSNIYLSLGCNAAVNRTCDSYYKGYIYAVRINEGSLTEKALEKNRYIDRMRYGF